MVSAHRTFHPGTEISNKTNCDDATCDELGSSVTQGQPDEGFLAQPAGPGEANGPGQLLEKKIQFWSMGVTQPDKEGSQDIQGAGMVASPPAILGPKMRGSGKESGRSQR